MIKIIIWLGVMANTYYFPDIGFVSINKGLDKVYNQWTKMWMVCQWYVNSRQGNNDIIMLNNLTII